jgi:2-desacetyl-2-hydroxyethyl bacteriochlorophyllide A dehydrogenase
MKSSGLVFESPHKIGIRETSLGTVPSGALAVRTTLSAISAGTEMLFFRGLVPDGMMSDRHIPSLQKASYPLPYGYAAVGEVIGQGKHIEGDWEGRQVFSFQPHVSHFFASPDDLLPIPPGMPAEDAVFLPFMETAVNLALDGAPLPGEKTAIFGQGVIGLLTAGITAACCPLMLGVIDRFPLRRGTALSWGADFAVDPATADSDRFLRRAFAQGHYDGADLVYELTGEPAVLDEAIRLAGFNGRIIVGSWYGAKKAPISLGGDFHRKRCAIISSQVSTIQPLHTGRWNTARRRSTALHMIKKLRPQRLITQLIERAPEQVLQVVLEY